MSLQSCLDEIKKKFSKSNPDIIFDPKKRIKSIPSGCFVFDLISGCGGFPRERLSEVFGMEHSGKSSLMYASLAGVQAIGGVGVLLDFEQSFDPVFAKDVFDLVQDGKTFIIFSPSTIEEGDAILEILFKKTPSGFAMGHIDLLVQDSVEAMKPKGIIEASLDDERRIGAQAQAVSRWVAKMRLLARYGGFASVFTNQMRTNIKTDRFPSDQNIGTGAGYNVKEAYTTPGGLSLRFYASLRIKLEYGGKEETEGVENPIMGTAEKVRTSNQIKIINIKNKVGVPFLKGMTNFDFPMFGQKGGWNEGKDVIDILERRGRITQRGTKFVYEGLTVPEWSHIGSKKESINLFCSDKKLVEDGKALIRSLMDDTQTLFDQAKAGEDFKEDDLVETPAQEELDAIQLVQNDDGTYSPEEKTIKVKK